MTPALLTPAGSLSRAPGHLPLLGHSVALLRDTKGFLESLAGVGDVVRVNVGTVPVYFLTTPELVRRVLVTDAASFEKGRFFDQLRPLFGNGLLVSSGSWHHRQRRLVQPAFHRSHIKDYAGIMRRHAQQLADSWHPGQTVDVVKAMSDLAAAVVSEAMIRTPLGATVRAVIGRSLPDFAQGAVIRALMPATLSRLPLPFNRRFDTAARELRSAIEGAVRTYRADDGDHADLLSMLLRARDADTGEPMTDAEIRDELINILIAGTEVTAMTLAWAFHELDQHPDIAERCRAEALAATADGPVTVEALPGLGLIDRVLNEVCRRHAALFLMRRTTAPITLGSVHVPQGADIGYSIHALHHDQRHYTDPDRFDPDRWLPGRQADLPKGAFIPFSAGNAKCVGDGFAWTEMKIVLATLLSRWHLRQATGNIVGESLATIPRPTHLTMSVESATAADI
ncbi:cytochrome P450 [Streptomyces spiroverticillatus]|uniref:Cytochrome P450 n=1 Tax=Streptomyces finlayi TaxID=67296 RepID=A0A919CDZ1_9ACTN|nr:cytochrome P450 [Streptomyces finlayi]GHA43443.1 cytochrome P450 [Streptomyces spiroverticillatus]GHD13379.1 cytochrome P450 [Streptomyces finlayi]